MAILKSPAARECSSVRVAGRLPKRLVRNAFALVVVAAAAYTLGRSAPGLLTG